MKSFTLPSAGQRWCYVVNRGLASPAEGLCLCQSKGCFTNIPTGRFFLGLALHILSSVTLILTLTYTVIGAFMEQTAAGLKTQHKRGRVCSRLCYLYACVRPLFPVRKVMRFPLTLIR